MQLEHERMRRQKIEAEVALRRVDRKLKKLYLEKEREKQFQLAVIQDLWTQEQQEMFEEALLKFTADIPKHDRWTSVAANVPGKSKQQCIARYKYIKQLVSSSANN